MYLTFSINEGQRVETAIYDMGLAGKALLVSVKELDDASGDDKTITYGNLPYETGQDVTMQTEDGKFGLKVTVTVRDKY